MVETLSVLQLNAITTNLVIVAFSFSLRRTWQDHACQENSDIPHSEAES